MKVTKQTKDQKKSTQNNGKTTQKRVAKKTTYVYKVHSTQDPQPKIYNQSSSSYQRQGNFSGNFQKINKILQIEFQKLSLMIYQIMPLMKI